jgi:hypothetical protein
MKDTQPQSNRSVSAFAINKMYESSSPQSPPIARKSPGIPSNMSPLIIVSPTLNGILSPSAMEKALNKLPPLGIY